MTAQEAEDRWNRGYQPRSIYDSNPELREAIDCIARGTFSPEQPDLFRPIVDSLLYRDTFMVLADYQAYMDSQSEVARSYRDRDHWTSTSILNTARMGKFSSDRTIRDYCRDIWNIPLSLPQRTEPVR